MKKYKIAVIGATGMVGRTALKILEEYNIDGEMFARGDIKDMTLDEKWNTVKELKELIKGR